jgi:hypothetical protein
VCQSAGHTSPGPLRCDRPEVVSVRHYPPPGPTTILPPPAGIEYEPGADWHVDEEDFS